MLEDPVKQGFERGRLHFDLPAWPLALPLCFRPDYELRHYVIGRSLAGKRQQTSCRHGMHHRSNSMFILLAIVLLLTVVVTSFNVPPSGLCFVPSGGDCFRCDCMKPLKCYKGVCR
ncbi:hypothetical protein Y032_0028g1715 [Ancylostoma ceylanicum]|nr:hypothetical protein Y032_0028g1715 [Ancylostoma ceylanicum]